MLPALTQFKGPSSCAVCMALPTSCCCGGNCAQAAHLPMSHLVIASDVVYIRVMLNQGHASSSPSHALRTLARILARVAHVYAHPSMFPTVFPAILPRMSERMGDPGPIHAGLLRGRGVTAKTISQPAPVGRVQRSCRLQHRGRRLARGRWRCPSQRQPRPSRTSAGRVLTQSCCRCRR